MTYTQAERDAIEADHAIEVDLMRRDLRTVLTRIQQDRQVADRCLAQLNRLADAEVEGSATVSLVNALAQIDVGVNAALNLAPEPDSKVSTA